MYNWIMALSSSQKKLIKRNAKNKSLSEIAELTGASKDTIGAYLNKKWGRDKYYKYLQQFTDKKTKQKNLSSWFGEKSGVIALLSMLVFLVYLNSFDNALVSDDLYGLVQNPSIGSFSLVTTNLVRFMRELFYFVIYNIAGTTPFLYRLGNILFHLGTSIILYAFLTRHLNEKIGLLAASIFAIHPVMVESVAWISGGVYAQYGFFFMLSLFFYSESINYKNLYLWSLIFYALSLFSSEKAFVLASVFFLWEYVWGNLKQYRRWLPFIAFSGTWFLLFVVFGGILGQRSIDLTTQFYQEGSRFYNPLIQLPTAISTYARLIFYPMSLSFYYSEFSFTEADYAIRVVFSLIVVGLYIISFFKNKKIFFFLSLAIISLSPFLTPLRIAWVVAERYAYLATLGVISSFSIFLFKYLKKFPQWVFWTVLIVIVSLLSLRTIIRNNAFQNEDNLWLATAKTAPSDPKTHNNLGDYYSRHQDYDKAILEFTKAIELNPNYADAYHNRGLTYMQKKESDKAISDYQKAIELNPALWQSYRNLAGVYFDLEQIDSALNYMQKAIEKNPDEPHLWTNLGAIYLELKQKEKAVFAFEQALKLNPNDQVAPKGLLEANKL